MITNLEGWQHRPGRDLEGLNDKGADKESQEDGNENGLNVLPDDGFLGLLGMSCHGNACR